jgi:hypothetical protein
MSPLAGYPLTTVLGRWNRFHSLIVGVAFAALSVLSFANGHHVTGPLYLVIGTYELVTFFQNRRQAALGGPKAEGQRP